MVHWKKSITHRAQPYPDAVETLQRLEEEGHEIYYITARPKEHGERTMEWMIEQWVSGS